MICCFGNFSYSKSPPGRISIPSLCGAMLSSTRHEGRGGAGQDGQLRDAQYERTVALINQSENGEFINQS